MAVNPTSPAFCGARAMRRSRSLLGPIGIGTPSGLMALSVLVAGGSSRTSCRYPFHRTYPANAHGVLVVK
ncbi:MAG: hypothetical protein ABIP57_01145 [Jatrophihabitantaceae bacterium]